MNYRSMNHITIGNVFFWLSLLIVIAFVGLLYLLIGPWWVPKPDSGVAASIKVEPPAMPQTPIDDSQGKG